MKNTEVHGHVQLSEHYTATVHNLEDLHRYMKNMDRPDVWKYGYITWAADARSQALIHSYLIVVFAESKFDEGSVERAVEYAQNKYNHKNKLYN